MIAPKLKIDKLLILIRQYFVRFLISFLNTKNLILHSPQILPSSLVKKINRSSADIVHLHWVQGEMLSISDISKITKPIVWTFHDMWGICGAEHLTFEYRWRDGYSKGNRPGYESGFDLNRWTWLRKKRYWNKPFNVVAPSGWLANCVKNSALMKNWPVSIIPNPIDTEFWRPFDKAAAINLFGLPDNKKLILFGSMGESSSYHKGSDLLDTAITLLKNYSDFSDYALVIFGETSSYAESCNSDIKTYHIGRLSDNYSLRALYSAVDVVVVPSRIESFCQVASEASACGCPVVGFEGTGLNDIILHKESGYLAKSYSPADLAEGIKWVLTKNTLGAMGLIAKNNVVNKFSYPIVAKKYQELYLSVQ